MSLVWPGNALCSIPQVRGWVDQNRTGAEGLSNAYRGNLSDEQIAPIIGAVSGRMENCVGRSLALVTDGVVWVSPPRERRRGIADPFGRGVWGGGSGSIPGYNAADCGSAQSLHIDLMDKGIFPVWSVSDVTVEHFDKTQTSLVPYTATTAGYWLRDSDRSAGRITLINVSLAPDDRIKVTCTYGFHNYGVDGTLALPEGDDGTAAAAAFELSAGATAWTALWLTSRIPDEGKVSLDGGSVLNREYPIPTRVKSLLDQGYRRSPV